MEQPNPAEGTRAKIFHLNIGISWAVVVAQLVEQLPLIQRSAVQIQSLAKIYFEHLLATVLKRRKWPIKKPIGFSLLIESVEGCFIGTFRSCLAHISISSVNRFGEI